MVVAGGGEKVLGVVPMCRGGTMLLQLPSDSS